MKINSEKALMVDQEAPSDMFGPLPAKRKRQRGWTELDKLRRRLERLELKVSSGEYTDKDKEALEKLWILLGERYAEAREKWAKSFGR